MMISRLHVTLLLLLLIPSLTVAAEGPGGTGAAYLLYPVGSKSIAMGEVKSALLGEPFGWIANPGTLNNSQGFGVGIFHTEWILDTRYDNVSCHYRIHDKIILAGSLFYTYRPDIEGYNEFLEPVNLKSNNYQLVLGVGVSPIQNLTAGMNIKYFKEKLDMWSAGGAAFDFGLLYHLESAKTAIGFTVQNLGPDIQFIDMEEPLPVTFRFGLSQRLTPKEEIVSVTAAFDFVKHRFESLYISAGGELEFYELCALRAGYVGRESRAGSGFTMGGGFNVKETVSIDYAWTDYGDLGNFHHISVFFNIPK